MGHERSTLVVGLGNPLMGDDGLGWHAIGVLASDPRLPAEAEAIRGGSDLLRLAGEIEGRAHVVLIDAMLDRSPAGTIRVFRGDFEGLEGGGADAHGLSPVEAIRLLRLSSSQIASIRFTLVTVSIESARMGEGLSPAIEATLPRLAESVLGELSGRDIAGCKLLP